MISAYLLISLCITYSQFELSFYLVLLTSVLFGIICSFGGVTLLGFCKGFPGEVIGYFASGTGFAGIFGTSSILLLKSSIHIDESTLFFLMTPLSLAYYLAFHWLHSMKQQYPFISNDN